MLAVAQLSGQSDTVRVTLSSLTPAAAAATSTSEPGRDIPKAAAVEAGLTAASAAVGAGPGPGSLVGCHSGEAEHVLLAAEVAGPAQHPLLALQVRPAGVVFMSEGLTHLLVAVGGSDSGCRGQG